MWNPEGKSELSRDVAMAIRHYCFENLTEFFRRYESELKMSRATFFRVIACETMKSYNIEAVMEIARRVGVVGARKEGGEWLIQFNLIDTLVKLANAICDTPSIYNLTKLKEFMSKHGMEISR